MENKTETKAKTENKTETKAKTAAAPELVNIRIPIDPLNKWDKTVSVTINGKRTEYKRGETVSVPPAVVDILDKAGYL